jgi:hypothetical protein
MPFVWLDLFWKHRQNRAQHMAYFKFTFTNAQDDQTFSVTDLVDNTRNPIWSGVLNHNDVSPDIQCWVGSDGKGSVDVKGEHGYLLHHDVDRDDDHFDY